VNTSIRIARVAAVQGLQYVVPLLLLPLVAGWLGLLEFGRLFWFVSAFALVNAASGFGLEWSGTRKLAQASARADDWGSTVASLLRLRLVVTVLGLGLLWVALWVALGAAPGLEVLAVMLLLSVDSLANARYPNYAFFAAGQASRAARVQLEGRLVLAAVVAGAALWGRFGVLTYPLGMALGSTWVALRSHRWLRAQAGWTGLSSAPWSTVRQRALEGLPFFGITLLSLGYTTANILVVEAVSTPEELGYFTASSKLVVALNSIFIGAVGSVLFRDRLAAAGPDAVGAVHRSALVAVGALGLAIGLGLFLGSEVIVRVYYGTEFAPASASLRWMAWIPLCVGLSNVVGIQGLAALHRERWLYLPVFLALGLSVWGNFMLTSAHGAVGASTAWLMAEFALLLVSAVLYRRFSQS
jgi:PST family polysaccharide transporter